MSKSAKQLVTSIAVAGTALLASVLLMPPQWYSVETRLQLSQWFGVAAYRQAEQAIDENVTGLNNAVEIEPACPEDISGWRSAQQVEQVSLAASPTCVADNPYAVAAFVKGTNNVSMETLMASGLSPDAVVKGEDLDGDGDPDVIHIRLEVIELNGGSPDAIEPTTQFAVAPGINPSLWVFAPKSIGMSTLNFDSNQAKNLLRPPSPTIRIEQGDQVFITLENSHYLPHTIHFHGVDHSFLDAQGEGNDGVPITSEMPVAPGSARTYEIQARQSGTMFYHCHVQVQVHVMMGLQGMFVVEENRPNNTLQTLNIGAGHVRVSSQAVRQDYDSEYDLHFSDIDLDLNKRVQASNNPVEIEQSVNREYDVTQAASELSLLNGRAFPYTFQESLIVTRPDEKVKLRVVNGGSEGVSLHTHGHKTTATHLDGVEVSPEARVMRDVFWLSSAQRMDLELDTHNDGLHSYGSGVWLLHDHQEKSVTNAGIGPGGSVGAIVYEEFLDENGWPTTYGEDLNQFFDPSYYNRISNDESRPLSLDANMLMRLLALGIAIGIFLAALLNIGRAFIRNPS
ncbi:MAG: copper oxidase [SAR86 cluster bacterium]|uniref:Copper oxidase n=1 Tax=SAR86 cluster bacterium TaxID=2030880 RepID=A0A2A4MLP1_9GAMM|nr:MAG: copper oxidase [SAR86 cluster bacterium]